MRYRRPDSESNALIARPVSRAGVIGALSDHGASPFHGGRGRFRTLLHGGRFTGTSGDGDVIALAGRRADRPVGYRGESLQLVNLAASL